MSSYGKYHRDYYLANREKIKATSARRRLEKPEALEDARLRRVFGISLEDYNWMLEVQGGVCAICKRPETVPHKKGKPKKLTVDHDHKTGRVRGLLCQKCNSILGYAEDQPLILLSAVEYLGG